MEQEPKNSWEKYRIASLAFELGFIIALPLVGFLLLGKYLDERFNTDPFLKIAAIILALTITSIWLSRRFAEMLKYMRQDHNKDHKP